VEPKKREQMFVLVKETLRTKELMHKER